jgi:hypothetical protein
VATNGIAASAVTYGKLQNEAATSLLGNPTGAPAAPSEVTLATALAFSGTTLDVAAGGITLTKMVNLAANSVIGNNTGSPATPIALTQAQLTAMINSFTSTLAGDVPASGGGTTNFLRADGTWAAPPSATISPTVQLLTGTQTARNEALIVLKLWQKLVVSACQLPVSSTAAIWCFGICELAPRCKPPDCVSTSGLVGRSVCQRCSRLREQ